VYWKTEQIQNYYEKFAATYDVKHGVALYGQDYNFKTYYEPFLKSTIPNQGTVLEIGCGTGVYTRWLSERGLNVVAMDISPKMIELARQKAPGATFYEGDCENPASNSGVGEQAGLFDLIVGFNTFSYYPHKEDALKNYHALLKPGGRLVVIDMNGRSPYYQLMAWMNINEARQWLPEIKASNRQDLLRLLGKTGFTIDVLDHFSCIPNGLNKGIVNLLRPFNSVFMAVPFIRNYAMRIAYLAIKDQGLSS